MDFDATLIRTRADKEDARPTYKRTYGHHPLLAVLPATGEVLAGLVRPGNAGANCAAADHVTLLDARSRSCQHIGGRVIIKARSPLPSRNGC